MSKNLEDVIDSLYSLSDALKNGFSEDTTLSENFGWNYPTLNRFDLASIPSQLADSIADIKPSSISEDLNDDLEKIPKRIDLFISQTLPQIYNRNGNQAVPILFSLMEWVESVLKPLNSWETLYDNKALPVNLKRRLTSIKTQINNIVPEKEKIESQIKLIQDATEAAESLPTDLQSLKTAQSTIKELSVQSTQLCGEIDTHLKKAKSNVDSIGVKKKEADKLVDKCDEAYRITTTTGLAAAFDERTKKLSKSMYLWVGGLIIALCAAVLIGANRFDIIYQAINIDKQQWGNIWMNLVLSLFSLVAPIWFAWIATKQISQRFRLAEDYGYKASVAKAYEGYRKEAARLDPAFEARLFSSALLRLEEAPLRLMEQHTHGSPWHELISSPQFEKALDKVPELKTKFVDIANKFDKSGKNKENGQENYTSKEEERQD